MDVVIIKLTNLRRGDKGIVKRISKNKHECRIRGIKFGIVLDIVYHYTDKIVIIVNFRDTVIIPKTLALFIEVEKIK